VIEPSFGLKFQCIGLFKIPRSNPPLFIIKLREGMILLDAGTEQVYKLNLKQANSSMSGDVLRVVPTT